MNEEIDDITISYTENGTEVVKELGKCILTKGAWTTILFRYHEWNQSKQAFGPVKYSIRRFQKRNGQYWLKSKFTISSDEQANKIIKTLTEWIALQNG